MVSASLWKMASSHTPRSWRGHRASSTNSPANTTNPNSRHVSTSLVAGPASATAPMAPIAAPTAPRAANSISPVARRSRQGLTGGPTTSGRPPSVAGTEDAMGPSSSSFSHHAHCRPIGPVLPTEHGDRPLPLAAAHPRAAEPPRRKPAALLLDGVGDGQPVLTPHAPRP